MGQPPRVTVVTNYPSPYQVELFDALTQSGQVELQVLYTNTALHDRQWQQQAKQHAHRFIEQPPAGSIAELQTCALAVFTHYQPAWVRQQLTQRHRSGKPWCFWGERPGASGWRWLGSWRRRWYLRDLHRSRAAIWGIGQWAVQAWQAEFGKQRPYFNVPYFSNLQRFIGQRKLKETSDHIRLLYSGSLIHRKGVDLLARVCSRLLPQWPALEVDWVGDGPLQSHLQSMLAPWKDRVRFHGFQQWGDLPRYYAEADLLCVPSRYDGWAMVVPEGLAAGLPVIATDRMGAALDLIQPGHNGWIIKAGSKAALATALQEAMSLQPTQRQSMSERSAKIIEKHSLAHGVAVWLTAMNASLAGS